MNNRKKILLPIAIVLAGLLVSVGMVKFKPKASRSGGESRAPVVEVMTVQPATLPSVVYSTGTVTASKEVTMIPEVAGRIVYQSENLVPGGRFKKGQLIARIDSRDYSLSVKQQESQVRQAELELQLEISRQDTAKKEWELLGDDRPEGEAALALRKPHLETAKQNLEAAKSNLEKAKLSLARTSLRAPFNAVVIDEKIDVGQVVGAATAAATLIGSDRFRIKASVPVDRLGLLEVPGFNSDKGSKVEIIHDLGGGVKVVREGTLIGLAGSLDPQTRTAQLLVALDNPMDPPDGMGVIMYGAYVDLKIKGREVKNAYLLPRIALEQGRKVWLVDKNSKMISRDVQVGWGGENTVAVISGLAPGDRIVVTPLSIPMEKMKVETKKVEITDLEAKNNQEDQDEF